MSLLPVVFAFVLSANAEVRAVRLTIVDQRPALRILTSPDVPGPMVVREGDDVVITVAARASAEMSLPELARPLEALGVEQRPDAIVFRVRVAREVPFEATHEPGMTTILFGEQPAADLREPLPADLYARLFPTGVQATEPPAEDAAALAARRGEGLALGPVLLQPSLLASYVDADVTFGSPTPVREQYLEIGPGLVATLPLVDGKISADYQPRLRFFESIPELGQTSHFLNANVEFPLGSRIRVRASDAFTRAILESSVVDPGREYFYDLAPYTANAVRAGADVILGSRITAVFEGGLRTARFEESASGTQGFFDYDSRTLRAGLGYDLGADLRAQVDYSYESVPPSPDRAIVETAGHAVTATLAGPIGPIMTGTLSGGWSHRTSPQASGPSRSYEGLILSGTLRRELTPATSLELQLNRAATLSAFEQNAYYVTNSVGLALNVPLPSQVAARGSLIWFRNDYPNPAESIGVPRRDDILGWTAGLGRRIGSRSWLRFDYRREQRESNLPGFDVTTDGFSVQFGISATGTQR